LEIGGVYGTPRSERNGIVIDSAGHISAPLATADLAGTIIEPVADGKGYVRASQPDGSYQWVPPASAGAAYDFGIGITVDTTTTPNHTVSLEPAGIGSPAELGGIFVVPARGLSVNVDGGMSLVPATPDQIGGLKDAPWNIGDKYVRENGQWVKSTAGGVAISDTPPANPAHEDLWWESDTGALFIYYNDGNSSQWVQVNGESAPPAVYVADDPPIAPVENGLWWDSNRGTLNLWYTDVDTSQWVEVAAPQIPGVPEAPIDGVPYSRRDANWVATTSLAATPGDVKDGFQTNDHGGWIKLDGRAVNTLTSTQQAQAALLGFTTNLPDGVGAVALMNGTAMGAIAGNMAKTIAVANLPAHNMTSGGHDAGAVTTSNQSAGGGTQTTSNALGFSDAVGVGPQTGKIAAGGTGQYYI
jgi:hypothetical protein